MHTQCGQLTRGRVLFLFSVRATASGFWLLASGDWSVCYPLTTQHSCDTTEAAKGLRKATMKFLKIFTAATFFMHKWFATDAAPQYVRIGGIYPITDITTATINRAGAQWLAGSLMAAADLNLLYAKTTNYQFKLAVRDSRKTFSNTVVGCLALSKTVFLNNGSHVIVGAGKMLRSVLYRTIRTYHLYNCPFDYFRL